MGLGYIGLPTASLLGTKGFTVQGVDTSQRVVDTINRGEIHIVEPDLDILVKSAVQSGNLVAGTEPAEADIFIIAVPTPFKDGHVPDLSCVEAATEAVCPYLRPGNLVILESTSPVGTTESTVARIIRDHGHDLENDVAIAYCPERVLPGRILTELVENDRIVGGVSLTATAAAAEFYGSFVRGEILETDAKTAELAKLTENAFRDVNIAFANELSLVADQHGINVWELIALANRHPRVGILSPGPGVGGHCIAVDPWFIAHAAPEVTPLIQTARRVNDAKPAWVIDKVSAAARKFVQPTVACLGLSFKADVDDLRESPAAQIVETLVTEDVATVLVCEPNLQRHPTHSLVPYEEAIARADIIVVLVDHREFRRLRASDLKEKVLIDTRGIVN
jgi:UDP-N-acetyl-D-mannosaminuronic acid dehydrogenase